MRSIQARYLMPCYLGIPLAVAYLLATQISRKDSAKKIWQFVLIVMITVAFFLCYQFSSRILVE